MSRQDIEFKTSDHVILRGWLYTPSQTKEEKMPCLVMSHGFSAVKEMDLDRFAEKFVSELSLACLVYDNRGFGSSDCAPDQPHYEAIPSLQISDIQDAVTYAQTRKEVDASKIGVWGSSYSGGHCLQAAACDRRVKACISQVPMANGWDNFHRLMRPDIIPGLNATFEKDRQARAGGQAAATIPVVDANPLQPSVLPSADSYEFFTSWEGKSTWKNEATVRSVEAFRAYEPSNYIAHISPAPLLMLVADNDCVTPTDIALNAYARAIEPKQLVILSGGHFDVYREPTFSYSTEQQIEFLQRTLCK